MLVCLVRVLWIPLAVQPQCWGALQARLIVLGPQGPPCLATKLPFLHSHWVGLKDDFLSCTESGGFEPILGLGSFQARLPVARKGKKLGRSWKSRRIRESQSGAVLLACC